ncbi:DUF2452 domain-containing protein [Leptospira brenneri]|uniref:DUF2452 domain-containing protein n=1 Tax=Leptospira brenneri TaxID=2023182 RepID=A0A5F1Z2U3_9LEPT|nr:DUF2452 domain-containing protein [Leptospira brenneri]TGK91452.1 DUF2452 domain-containing protein [Leptospira brenneri]
MEESEIPHHSLTYGTSRLAPSISLVDRAKEIEMAEESVKLHVHGKLEIIANQIRRLKEEAEQILEQAEKDIELHKARCQFEKKPGQIIHLYEKETGTYFSLLSPNDWGKNPPHPYKGSYTMNPDRSFTEILKS